MQRHGGPWTTRRQSERLDITQPLREPVVTQLLTALSGQAFLLGVHMRLIASRHRCEAALTAAGVLVKDAPFFEQRP